MNSRSVFVSKTNLTAQRREEIDQMGYLEMLKAWRFTQIGSGMFAKESGRYFKEVMEKKKNKLSSDEQVKISKLVGLRNRRE